GDPEANGNTPVFGGIFTKDDGFTVGASSPGFIKAGDDFTAWIGSESGKLRKYTNISGNLDGIFDGGDIDFLPYSLGRNSTVIPADLNGDDIIDLILGTSRGGVHIFSSGISIGGSSTLEHELDGTMYFYPNPTNGIIQLNSEIPINRIDVYDLSGRKVLTTKERVLSLKSPGTYIARIITEKGVVTKKIINL
ncbi:MAG: T9SS type A sorting domain-containing protein, partial [Saprospiraceae bacterium]|nr:T9SS type A sorting domain-containing protein [Saprospiraceae bacterium]